MLFRSINEALNLKMEELDRCLDRAGKVLSQLSDYPVFTMAAAKERITVKRFDLLMVEENAFIAVVMTDSSVVKNKLIRIPGELSDPPAPDAVRRAEQLLHRPVPGGDGADPGQAGDPHLPRRL